MKPGWSITAYRPYARMPAHEHVLPSLSFVLCGGLRERVRGVEDAASAGAIGLKPSEVVHADEFGPGGALIACVRPTNLDREHLTNASLGGWRWLHGPAASRVTFMISAELRNDDPFGAAEEMVVGLLGGTWKQAPPMRGGLLRGCAVCESACTPGSMGLPRSKASRPRRDCTRCTSRAASERSTAPLSAVMRGGFASMRLRGDSPIRK